MKNKILNSLNKPFYALFGIVVLLVAVAGSAYAYYQATASNNSTVTGTAAGPGNLQLTVTKLSTSATGNLIPMDSNLTILNKAALGEGNTSGNYNATKQCIDKNGYTACQVYQISLTNNGTTPLIVTGGVTSLSGTNTPNLTCTLMSDNHTVTAITNCVGNNTLAKRVTINAGATNNYYVMVYIDNLPSSQSDNGTFNGTVEFNTGSGGVKASFYPTVEEKITSLFTKTGTVTEDPDGDAIVLDIDSTHSLIKDQRNNIRYYGAYPSNYIKFNCETYPDTNCETWRIIGLVDGKVKLIRGYSSITASWDTSASTINSGNGINQWGESVYSSNNNPYTGADLMKLLNPGYDNNEDYDNNNELVTVNNSLYYNSGSGTCYNGKSNATTTCDFTSTGIKNTATRNKIAETTFYTGDWNYADVYPNFILEKERNATNTSNASDGIIRTATWTGKIAIPYASDYGYAADLSHCIRKSLQWYDNTSCKSYNWMSTIMTSSSSTSWLLTPYSSNNGGVELAFYIYSDGSIKSISAYFGRKIFPVLYLSSDEVIESGEGTSSNPYRLAA